VVFGFSKTIVILRQAYIGEALRSSPLDQNPQTASLGGRAQKGWGKEMTGKHEVESSEGSRRQLQGLPVIRRNVAGIDLGSERHWVCAPTVDGSGREIASYGATTPELIRLAEWQNATVTKPMSAGTSVTNQ
jgi:hypothetical protein